MKVAVVGGGIAGLAAAWRLRERGCEVLLFERHAAAGGRCRSEHWRDAWRITGAYAFITAEENLVEQARALGIYDALPRVEMTDDHEQNLFYRRERLIRQRSFAVSDILMNEAIPAREKLALATAFPRLAGQLLRNDPRDLTTAAALDGETACGWFRRVSPAFVDYYLEPTMQMFCGYGEEDYSIAWLAWLMSGFQWAGGWWSFAERGVGQLTHSMEEAFARDPGVTLALATDARRIELTPHGARLALEQAGRLKETEVDAVVVAVPGSLVPGLMPGLDGPRRAFFDGVSYVGHHIADFVIQPGREPLPPKLMLPTADGFGVVSNMSCRARADGLAEVHGEIKGAFCAESAGASAATILDAFWEEACAAAPSLRGAEVIDRRLQRNDVAIARRPPGYVRALKDFQALPPIDHVAFAGDYLLNSTVGQSHWTGLLAADRLTGTGAAGRG